VANAHFGNFGDVWKHLVLDETLARESPQSYWETHAGSASYPLSHSPARDYGIYYLLGTGQRSSGVTRSTDWGELARFQAEEANGYPGQRFSQCASFGTRPTTSCATWMKRASDRSLPL
jgi:hypothetical protein